MAEDSTHGPSLGVGLDHGHGLGRSAGAGAVPDQRNRLHDVCAVSPASRPLHVRRPTFLALSKSHSSSIYLTSQYTILIITPHASPGIRCQTRKDQAPQNHVQSQRHVRRAARCISRPSLSSRLARDVAFFPSLPLPGDSRCHTGPRAVMERDLRQCAVDANATSARALAPTDPPATPPPSPGGACVLIWCELFGQG